MNMQYTATHTKHLTISRNEIQASLLPGHTWANQGPQTEHGPISLIISIIVYRTVAQRDQKICRHNEIL